MADPRRYWLDTDTADHNPVESPSGDWIKWHDFQDYKAAQRRNKSEEMNRKLGVEIAEMRSRIADLQAENERFRKALTDIEAAWVAKQAMEIVRIIEAAKGVQP